MTETPQPVVVAPDSPAGELIAHGATPIQPDVSALIDQILALQARVDALSRASGVPVDPISAAIKDLTDHVKVRAAMHPSTDFKELTDTLSAMPDKSTTKDAEYVRVLVDEFCDANAHVEGTEYLRQLAKELFKTVYKAERGE
jgi:hypothetical protein